MGKDGKMHSRKILQGLAVIAVLGVPACGAGVSSTQVPALDTAAGHIVSAAHRSAQSSRAFAANCVATPAVEDSGNCTNIETASSGLGPLTPAQQVPGLHPADLQAAYKLPSGTAGAGQTIGIVIVGNDLKLESDLAVYRSTFGLPACSSASGCFKVIVPANASSSNANWAHEVSADVDMASAACPKCKLLVVEADSAKYSDLATAVSAAVSAGANVVSNSYAIPESKKESSALWSHPGIPIVAATGDQGFTTVNWPAAATNVIAVGATTLSPASATPRGWTETAWSGSGSGCSTLAAKPPWQTDRGCAMRTVADIAAVGDPNTPVAVYDSYQDTGWIEMGGTSVATPIVAGVYALAANGTQLNGASSIYTHPSSLNAVSAGSNGSCSPIYLCTAGFGYSGPAGLGSPKGIAAF